MLERGLPAKYAARAAGTVTAEQISRALGALAGALLKEVGEGDAWRRLCDELERITTDLEKSARRKGDL